MLLNTLKSRTEKKLKLAIAINWLNQIGFRNIQSGMTYSLSVTIEKLQWTPQNHCCGIFVRNRKECRVEVDLVSIFSEIFHCFVVTLNKFIETTYPYVEDKSRYLNIAWHGSFIYLFSIIIDFIIIFFLS